MKRSFFRKNFLLATAIIAAVIVYGSLYPFAFSVPVDGIGPVRTLVGSWAVPPGRGDFLSNILLYMPLGLFAALAIVDEAGAMRRIGMAALLGTMLSISMELTQYYDVGRDTQATDVYANAIGAVLGAAGGCLFGDRFRWSYGSAVAHRVPLLLLAAWAGFRLFPYVPTIDLEKYKAALKPVLLTPTLTPYDLFAHTAMWLTIAVLIETICGARRARLFFPAFVGAALVAQIFVISTLLSLAQIVGAVVAYGLWLALLMGMRRERMVFVACVLCLYVIAERLEPFHFRAAAGSFGWIPFLSFMQGSIDVDVLSFFEKVFLYGGLIWLLSESGMRRSRAAALVAVILFLTSWAEIYLPDRSAEITDAVMAVIIAAVFGLVDPPRDAGPPQPDFLAGAPRRR